MDPETSVIMWFQCIHFYTTVYTRVLTRSHVNWPSFSALQEPEKSMTRKLKPTPKIRDSCHLEFSYVLRIIDHMK